MKKLFSLLLIAILLIGCHKGASSNQISKKDDVIVTVNGKNVTKGDIYTMMRHQNIAANIVDMAKQEIIDSKVKVTDELKAKATEALKKQKSSLGEYFKMYYGETPEQELLDKYFIPAAKQDVLMEEYFDKNKETILKENKPVKITLYVFDSKENAAKAITRLNAKEDEKKVVSELGTQAVNNRFEPQVYSSKNLPQIVNEFVVSEEGKQHNWNKSPLFDNQQNKYYLIKVAESDATKLADEYKSIFTSEQTSIAMVYKTLFKEANFKVYDQVIFEAINADEKLADFKPGK